MCTTVGSVGAIEALDLANSGWWEAPGCTKQEVVGFQLFHRRLCMPLWLYQQAVCMVLGRHVSVEELVDRTAAQTLRDEALKLGVQSLSIADVWALVQEGGG